MERVKTCRISSERWNCPGSSDQSTVICTNVDEMEKMTMCKVYSVKRPNSTKYDIFAYDILPVPVHLSVHRCVAVLDFVEKRIDYYDSLLGGNQKCLDNLKQRRWSMTLESKWFRRGSRTLDRKWSKCRGRHPAASNLNNQSDPGAPSERSFDFIQTTQPQIVINPSLLSPYNLVIV
ncbi:SUMO1 sentrin specific peptidase 1 [Parelaphostrongylus tenuis]|uniref:SUMO1 sentrin specific peptidase 1 n=1 Tax=Parelaphostrongylus tenuis TaxID=148309 RepID=A0AAD5WKQ6_PARTN|nr:SUMO1 sentrin specific peptidase 1 [Parelaphostrongylus tenuis]